MAGKIVCLTLLFIIAVGGCAQYSWQKAGASPQVFNQDKYRCMQESTRQQYSSQPVYNSFGQYLGQTASGSAYTDWGMYNVCMQAAGWNLVRR